ncbi:hypothetical protein ACH0C8_15630, partial [Acetobacter lovaniensis]|uniref:hypothetical protein n=1 Tax=Acetobacter lovaniensis TaxID=104100 RepID=UPI0037703C9E
DYAFTKLNDNDKAFSYVESSRARSLLSGTNPDTVPLTLGDLKRDFPAGIQMLYYAVLPERVLVWQISSTQVKVTAVAIDSKVLSDKIDEHRR